MRLSQFRYSEEVIRRAVAETETHEWLTANSTPCAFCKAPVVKRSGCNHMTCTRCSGHFCFLCGGKLPKENPYAHFSDKSVNCYNRLFDIVRPSCVKKGQRDQPTSNYSHVVGTASHGQAGLDELDEEGDEPGDLWGEDDADDGNRVDWAFDDG